MQLFSELCIVKRQLRNWYRIFTLDLKIGVFNKICKTYDFISKSVNFKPLHLCEFSSVHVYQATEYKMIHQFSCFFNREYTPPPPPHTYTTQTLKAEIYISMKLGHLSFLKNILAPQSLKYDT